MAVSHGVYYGKIASSVSVPADVASGVPFVVGTSPVQQVDGLVNEVFMANSYDEAVEHFGYSDDWKSYGISEAIYTLFSLYQGKPVFLVNVLDPKKHKKDVEAKDYNIIENQIKLPLEAIKDTVKVKDKVIGVDYDTFYDNTNCVIEFLEDTTGTANVEYKAVAPEMVTKSDIIGGIDIKTHEVTGMELIDDCFPKYTIVPDIILCPNWAHDSEVAAIMSAKCENINGLFEAVAILDIDTSKENGVTYYSDAPEWKKKKNFTKTNQLVCYPKLRLGDRIFNYSTQLAGLIARTDNTMEFGDGTPCESSSNKSLQADSTCLADGTEITLDLIKANYLNENGIITGLNFYNGFVAWGNTTACFPANTDPVDYFYNINRMFRFVGKTVILSYWNKIDRRMTSRLIGTIVQATNDWLNSLVADEKLLGGRVEFLKEENSATALASGKVKFHVYLTPPSPMQQMEWVLEYDLSYLDAMVSKLAG